MNSSHMRGMTIGLGTVAAVGLFILALVILAVAPEGLIRLLFLTSFVVGLGAVVTWLVQLSRRGAGRS